MTPTHPAAPPIVLGSTSRYRAELLRRLLADFEQSAPGTDESPRPMNPRQSAHGGWPWPRPRPQLAGDAMRW